MTSCTFSNRHIGPSKEDQDLMLNALNHDSIESLIKDIIPSNIYNPPTLNIPEMKNEQALLSHLDALGKQNTLKKPFIGYGYYNTYLPPVIQRNILENPGWYTQYTPYQAEISQGRLEALINFQTVITELTGLPIANASLLDEATAAAEAMTLLFRARPKEKNNARTLQVHKNSFPQSIQVLKTRASHLDINIELFDDCPSQNIENTFAIFYQFPDKFGSLLNNTALHSLAQNESIPIICATDLLFLVLADPFKDTPVDICVGSSQRFGVPLGFGGPHAAFFATKDQYARKIPGRIIGASIDKFNKKAYRMALQTREQHIRKEKATSNICTAQALLAIIAGMYAVYHGPEGLTFIANRVHSLATQCAQTIKACGFSLVSQHFFDTISLHCDNTEQRQKIKALCHEKNIELNLLNREIITIAFDETHSEADLKTLETIFKSCTNIPPSLKTTSLGLPESIHRKTPIMTQRVFHSHRSETSLLRYMKTLENKDLSLTQSMIPLGSCTMKLNATSQMMALSNPNFSSIHPYTATENHHGYTKIIQTLGKWLCDITQFDDISFQPNSGAQGEYAGILAIKAYLNSQNEGHRNKALIPVSSHGTNPASASMAGLDVVPIKCEENGDVDIKDLELKLEKHGNETALLMITYPSTHGVFETNITDICQKVHDVGAQVYMDGANLNAQVGLTSPGQIGADLCHINLHKTFAIPHGGGGPGMGPICVKSHLSPFLPNFSLDLDTPSNAVSAAEYSSASILLISYAYIALLGKKGITQSSKIALLNANYIRTKLAPYYPILFTGENGHVAHELIIDCRPFKKTAGIDVEDIAKRLMDYAFHAPTLSWPVPGTLMIEPTESESLAECNRFCDAMIQIYNEIQEIISGKADKINNVLKNAPHTQAEICSDNWDHPYSRKKAAFPCDSVANTKYWPTINRVNQAQGDRELICTCDPSVYFENA